MVSENEILIKGLSAGDTRTYEALFKRYYPKLTFYANRFVNDINVAEEVTGEVFTVLWEKREQLNFSVSVNSYLYKMTQNRCLNYLKHQKIENLYLNYLQRNNLLDSFSKESMNDYDDKELATQIRIAIDSLPEKCRRVFMMSRFQDMKYKDIAIELDISSKTVERHMGIALEKLRRTLKHVAYFLFF
jgi:RNA polymerase sigma-70 factor (family 1)